MMPRTYDMTTLVRRCAALAAVTIVLLACVCPAAALAVESPNKPSSIDLVEQPKTWDGRAVTFRGEVIGEAMVRGDMAWLHLNDDAYYLKNVEEGSGLNGYNSGMPVWIAAGLTKQIEVFGDYKHEGEVVEVRGTFNAACAEHGGDLDIHATTLVRVLPGRHAIDAIRTWKVALAVALSLLAGVLWMASRYSSLTLERGAVTRQRA